MKFIDTAKKYKRQILVILGICILLGALAVAWYFFSGESSNEQKQEASIAIAVEVMEVKNQQVKTYIELTGRLEPEDRVDIYSEVNGILETTVKDFEAGIPYKRGELLLRINDDEMQESIASQRSQFISLLATTVADLKIDFPSIYEPWANYLAAIDPAAPLQPLPEVENRRQKLFLTGRNIYSQYYSLNQMEKQLAKYSIYAPFNGTVTEALINPGTLVMQSQKLGEFSRSGLYQLRSSVGLKERQYIRVGDTVKLSVVDMNNYSSGTVERINEKIDPQMQTVEIFVQVKDDDLTAGMYMQGQIEAEEFEEAIQIPRRILIGQNSVFVVQDSTALLREVEIIQSTADDAVIKGLQDGALLIMEERTSAFEGSKVSPVKQ